MIQARAREEVAPPPEVRVGFTATKKIGGAVTRNRAKRRLREVARALLPVHGRPATDYVFVARSGTPGRPWARLLDDAKSALISLVAGGDPPQARGGRRGAPHGGRPSAPREPPSRDTGHEPR
jgi:ribonuclease P protein component